MKIGPPPKASCARLVAAMEWRRGGTPAETRRQAIPRFDVFLCGKGAMSSDSASTEAQANRSAVAGLN
jgi:hypothetical protein